jgi:hypothetical protein
MRQHLQNYGLIVQFRKLCWLLVPGSTGGAHRLTEK